MDCKLSELFARHRLASQSHIWEKHPMLFYMITFLSSFILMYAIFAWYRNNYVDPAKRDIVSKYFENSLAVIGIALSFAAFISMPQMTTKAFNDEFNTIFKSLDDYQTCSKDLVN